jgi:hypothetical protein
LTNNTSGKPPDPGHDPPDAPTCEQLQSTAVFCAVSTYLFNFSRFFYLLSGGGLSAKSLHSIKAFNVENTYLKDNILDMYLEPLKNNGITLSSQSLAIWAVARKFVKLRCLQSVQEVQDYLMTVGRVGLSQDIGRRTALLTQSIGDPADRTTIYTVLSLGLLHS